jgi:hypothetical protein
VAVLWTASVLRAVVALSAVCSGSVALWAAEPLHPRTSPISRHRAINRQVHLVYLVFIFGVLLDFVAPSYALNLKSI